MIVNIFGNGSARASPVPTESKLVAGALHWFGHEVALVEPVMALNGLCLAKGDRLVVTPECGAGDHLLETLAARYPKVPIDLRVARPLRHEVEDILEFGNIEVLHVPGREARVLTQLWPLDDSARELNKYRPATVVVVTDPALAVACQYGRMVKRESLRIWNPPNDDGLGSAFFAGFVGWYLRHPDDLTTSLVAGHTVAAMAALGLWSPALPPDK